MARLLTGCPYRTGLVVVRVRVTIRVRYSIYMEHDQFQTGAPLMGY